MQTADWDLPPGFGEPSGTRAADAYKLGLVILRLFAGSHDARSPAAHLRCVPVELRDFLYRSLGDSAVNRPTAGEWQRALGALLADGRVAQRYPGPSPAPRIRTAAPAAARVSAVRVAAPAPAPRAVPAASALRAAPRSAVPNPAPRAGALWLRRAVVVLWIVGGTVVLALILSRLFAGAIPVSGDGGSSSGAGAQAPYLYQPYGYPDGRGGGGGAIQLP